MSAEKKKNLRTNPKVKKNQQRKLLAWPQFKPTEENEQIHEQEVTKTLGKYGCRLRVPGTHAIVLHFFCDGILWLNTLKKRLNLSSIDIWGWLTLSGSFVHRRMSSSIPNLYALDTRSTPPLLVTTKNVPEVWMEQNRSAENHSSPGEHE